MKILVTGTAGFIGYHLVDLLIKSKHQVYGIDNINNYYDVRLKKQRLLNHGISIDEVKDEKKIISTNNENYTFIKADLSKTSYIINFLKREKFDCVINLAAQAGVRYSIEHPLNYVNSNLIGFYNILEGSRRSNVKHLIYASTSSVYGLNSTMPLKETQSTEHPVSFYAATKKSNEIMAHSYSHLYGIPTTGLRFFTVYGPWGRPDMALFLFTKAMLENNKINVFNHGKMIRDFTYVFDIVKSIELLIDNPPLSSKEWSSSNPDPSFSSAPYSIMNIGNSSPTNLMDFIIELEKKLEIKAKINYMDIQPGDVPMTFADNNKLFETINYKPKISIKEGISNFVDWYKKYYLKL